MSSTYKAIEVTTPGQFTEVTRSLTDPGVDEVRIRVEACGVCHSDAATMEGLLPITFPRVPGHEVVGVIDAIGDGVKGWSIGQRVGVGFLGGACGYCDFCRGGHLVNCKNQGFTGIHSDGGYAQVMIAKASGLVHIPEELSSVHAAPLLCAGITTFSALRNSSAKAGDLVAIVGVGGLGHLGVQYARRMGFEVVAISRGPDADGLASKLGAHHYVDSMSADVGAALQSLGGAQLVLITAPSGDAVSSAFKGLRPGGVAIVVGVGPEPIQIGGSDLVFQGAALAGALTGNPATGDATLRFSALSGAEAMIETMPLERAPEAYAKMMAGKARFRIVLTI